MLTGLLSWNANWEMWSFYNNPDPADNWIVMFDGYTRTIWVLDGVTEVLVREDLYSSWKEWALIDPNSEWLHAFTTEGGIPISDTRATGVTYLLQNGWTIRQRTGNVPVNVVGNLYAYDEDGVPRYPYNTDPNGIISINSTVSNLVDTVIQQVAGPPSLTPEQEWTLQLAYEEARRARIMQTNPVEITNIGTEENPIDNIRVFDDDGSVLYEIRVTGSDCDNRFVQYVKPYCPETTSPLKPDPCE